jgi:hypothetical protein
MYFPQGLKLTLGTLCLCAFIRYTYSLLRSIILMQCELEPTTTRGGLVPLPSHDHVELSWACGALFVNLIGSRSKSSKKTMRTKEPSSTVTTKSAEAQFTSRTLLIILF